MVGVACQCGGEGLAGQTVATFDSGELEKRRGDVDDTERARDNVSRADAPRSAKDERHSDLFFVDREGMEGIAVIHQALAVVGGDDDERVGRINECVEAFEQASDLFIAIGDLAVVEASVALARREAGLGCRELCIERRRRVTGLVGVEVVNEEEERARVNPRLEPFDRARRSPLRS